MDVDVPVHMPLEVDSDMQDLSRREGGSRGTTGAQVCLIQ
jgi:hypothetical protein